MDTRDMKPGRELDALVAEKVMGYIKSYLSLPDNPKVIDQYHKDYVVNVKRYSTDISAAWEVVEKQNIFPFSIAKTNSGKWTVNWCPTNYECMNCDEECQGKYEVESDTAPHAICIASILAMEDKA